MATLTGRWSVATARERWAELRAFNGTVLAAGILVMALWPLVAMIDYWDLYTAPVFVAGIYVASVALPMAMWRLGPRGIGPVTSLLSIAVAITLALLLRGQLDPIEIVQNGASFWLNSWATTTFFVLALTRPAEEPALGFVVITAIDIQAYLPRDASLFVLQNAPGRAGAAFVPAVAILGMVMAQRAGVRAVARGQALAAAAEQQLAVTDAVARERAARFVGWEATVAPLLEDLAAGRRDAAHPAVVAEAHRLGERLRAQLSAVADSLFVALLRDPADELARRGGELTISDVDIGFRLRETDRIMLVQLVTDVCARPDASAVELTLLGDAEDGTALIVLAVTGTPVPPTPAWQRVVHDPRAALSPASRTSWYWDLAIELDPAPAVPRGAATAA